MENHFARPAAHNNTYPVWP